MHVAHRTIRSHDAMIDAVGLPLLQCRTNPGIHKLPVFVMHGLQESFVVGSKLLWCEAEDAVDFI